MTESYIKIYRKLEEWEWYTNSKMVHLFIHLLIKANYKDGSWRGIPIKRGQRVTGRNSLMKETGISPQSIRTCLFKLKLSKEITIKSTKHFSIITLCNYNKYQKYQPTNSQQLTNNQPTTNQQLTTNKETNNTNNTKKVRQFSPPTLLEIKKFCLKRKNTISAGKFFNYYASMGWLIGGVPMRSWRAAIKYWEETEKKQNYPQKNGSSKNRHDATIGNSNQFNKQQL